MSDTWLLANMVGEGRTPLLTTEELAAIGFNIAIHPHPNQLVPFAEFNQLIGFEEIWKLDERLSR